MSTRTVRAWQKCRLSALCKRRKRSSLPKKRLDAITHEVIDLIERRIELENLFPQSPVKAFATVDGLASSITALDQIEEVAECVREAWNLGFDPIPDLVDVLETNGIRVFIIEADVENKFDGLAARVGGMPIVVVGRHWPGGSQTYVRPGRIDLFALALAELEKCPLLTGDAALRLAAETEQVEVKGTIWLIGERVREQRITVAVARAALHISRHGFDCPGART